jgi:hypothetical protein
LGRADCQHDRGALAGALQGDGLRERISGRAVPRRTCCRYRLKPSSSSGTSTISRPNAGASGTKSTARDFAKLIWQLGSPKWAFDDATFDRSAAAFANPDHVAIVIHNYRWRLGVAQGERKYDGFEKRLAEIA